MTNEELRSLAAETSRVVAENSRAIREDSFPEHRGKKLFGILAAVTIPENLRIQALSQGLFLATVKDDVFELSTPADFVPRPFGLRGLSPGS